MSVVILSIHGIVTTSCDILTSMKEKKLQELRRQVSNAGFPVEEKDLALSKEQLIAKYKGKYERGEVSEDVMRAYVTKLREERKEWKKKLEDIDYAHFDTKILFDIPPVFHKEIALKIIKAGKVKELVYAIGAFKGLDSEIALKILDAQGDRVVVGMGWGVAENLKSFDELNEEVAFKLIEQGEGIRVVENLERFAITNYNAIVDELFETDQEWVIPASLEKFKGVDRTRLFQRYIEEGKSLKPIVVNIEKFEDIDQRVFVPLVIRQGGGEVIAKHAGKFNEYTSDELARTLIDAGERESVKRWKDKFKGLSKEILDSLK